MAVVAYYLHDDEEFDPDTNYHVFCDVDWEKSANTVLLFREGLKKFNNQSRRNPGTTFKPTCLLFNVLALEIGSSKFSLRSIGYSILPLDIPGLTCAQGYFQLPVYRHPFVIEMIETVKPLEAWGLVEGMNKTDQNLKVLNCSLFVRLQLSGFEGWLERPLNFDLMNCMLMPSYLPRHRVVVTKEGFQETIKSAKPLKKTQDKADFELDEVNEYIHQYVRKLRKKL